MITIKSIKDLTKEKLMNEELQKIFDGIDLDHSGLLDKMEMETAVRKLGKSEEETNAVLGEMTKDQVC